MYRLCILLSGLFCFGWRPCQRLHLRLRLLQHVPDFHYFIGGILHLCLSIRLQTRPRPGLCQSQVLISC